MLLLGPPQERNHGGSLAARRVFADHAIRERLVFGREREALG